MVTKLSRSVRSVLSLGVGYSVTLFAAGITGICLMGGTAVIAGSSVDPRVCIEQFQREVDKCQTLTGFARARCQQNAARTFQACRAQAGSPVDPGPNALASVALPGAPQAAANTQTGDVEVIQLRARPTRANKFIPRSRER